RARRAALPVPESAGLRRLQRDQEVPRRHDRRVRRRALGLFLRRHPVAAMASPRRTRRAAGDRSSGGVMTTPRTASADRIPSLDGLRAISIGLVLFSHLAGTRGFPISAAAANPWSL